MQILILKNEVKQLIRMQSPITILYLENGSYEFTSQIRAMVEYMWDISEYTGELTLEVLNG